MNWYLLQTKHRQDAIAEENLRRQNYRFFRPVCQVESKVAGKIKIKEESLFPGYMFIQLGKDEDWSPIRSTIGVKVLVRFGEHVVPVPDSLIVQLQMRVQTSNLIKLFEPGSKVRITSGAFAGLDAVFCCKSAEDRVVVLLEILHRQHRVAVPISTVAAC